MHRILVVGCGVALVLSAMAPANAWAQEANEAERSARQAEAAVRAKELAVKTMADQLEAQQRALEDQQKMMQAKLEAQQKAFEAQQRAYEKAMAEAQAPVGFRDFRGGSPDSPYYRTNGVSQEAFGELGTMGQTKPAPLPENAQTRVFPLRNVPAPAVGSTIAKILGDAPMRMAVDERTNSIVISGDEKVMALVEKLVMQLGETARSHEVERPVTLQLRIIWLLDGLPVSEQRNRMVSPQVLDALKQLGFESPAVICQQINTMTLGDDKGRGRFQFGLPVLVNEQTWQLSGSGSVSPAADHQFGVEFELQCAAPDGGRGSNRRAQLSGSIYTPFDHYTVMGTTTFVEPGNEQEGPQQHLSAFVVYLDRAPEFPAAEQVHAEDAPR